MRHESGRVGQQWGKGWAGKEHARVAVHLSGVLGVGMAKGLCHCAGGGQPQPAAAKQRNPAVGHLCLGKGPHRVRTNQSWKTEDFGGSLGGWLSHGCWEISSSRGSWAASVWCHHWPWRGLVTAAEPPPCFSIQLLSPAAATAGRPPQSRGGRRPGSGCPTCAAAPPQSCAPAPEMRREQSRWRWVSSSKPWQRRNWQT